MTSGGKKLDVRKVRKIDKIYKSMNTHKVPECEKHQL